MNVSLKDLAPVLACWVGKERNIISTFFYRKAPMKWTLKRYKKMYGIKLDLENPKTFYEKMNYWKHNYYNEKQTTLADKLEVKKVLENHGFINLCPKTLFYSKNIKDIKNWFYKNKDKYNQFVFKTNHSCGDVYIYNRGVITKKYGRIIKNINTVFKCLKIGLNYNHYYSCFERPYKDIEPYIFIEEYIEFDNETSEYELMFNYGKLIVSKIVKERQNPEKHSEALIDNDFVIISKEIGFENIEKIEKPLYFDQMIEISKTIISEFPYCRCDFIVSKGKLYFCEFTFVKSGGIGIYKPFELEKKLGDMFLL